MGYLGFGIAMAWGHLNSGAHLEAMDVLSRLLVGVEQAAIDSSRWDVAWALTHLPEPPWTRMQAASSNRGGNQEAQFGGLVDPSWVTTALALKRDLSSLTEHRKKGAGRGKPDEDKK